MDADPKPIDAALLEDLRELTPEMAAKRLAEFIAAPPRVETDALAQDVGVIELLNDRRAGDPILDHLPLTALEHLADRCAERLISGGPKEAARESAWQLLDVLRRSSLLCRIAETGSTDEWSRRVLTLVEASDFTFGRLFEQRTTNYGERTLFRVPADGENRKVSWRQAAGRVDLIARSLLAIIAETGDRPLAILSHNSLEMALVDLACLSTGIVNIMVPATATETDVAFILEHAKVGALVVSDAQQLQKVLNVRDRLPNLGPIIALEASAASARDVIGFEHLLARSSETTPADLARRRRVQKIDDLATVMYTSGTTGTPKGICFTQRNIVFKRFARALALPEIGEDDRFLCYLPL
ncbi:MAG: AMP-binding protein, partial [Acidobacteria bacterium]|nr:AMP-binding protein [Candidatus Sulfomarinibacter sp. MAG AM2]